jgi:hypothetical protein
MKKTKLTDIRDELLISWVEETKLTDNYYGELMPFIEYRWRPEVRRC